jgi:hypothetical protein
MGMSEIIVVAQGCKHGTRHRGPKTDFGGTDEFSLTDRAEFGTTPP